MESNRYIAILGSTGSIGNQALEVVEALKPYLKVSVLTANNNYRLLAKQAIKFQPNTVVIANEKHYEALVTLLEGQDIKIFCGHEAIEQVVAMEEIDVVLTAMVGFAGLRSTVAAIRAGKAIALANKETLVVAGDYIAELAKVEKAAIIPVDSEHSALFQCLVGEKDQAIEKIYLTASGGPFRGKNRSELEKVTRTQALKHPNWEMGAKITIDSATMMNKGLEVIEAKWLFGLDNSQIDVIVHPESIIHSIVQFRDGSMKAQMGTPDMRTPIQYALTFPERMGNTFPRFDFSAYSALHFEKPDMETFANLRYAFEALEQGGNLPCALNAANEISVQLFLEDKISFTDIFKINEKCLELTNFISKPGLEDYFRTDEITRETAKSLV